MGCGLDEIRAFGEGSASPVEFFGEAIEGIERRVGAALVGERAETLGGLQLGRSVLGGRKQKRMPSGIFSRGLTCQSALSISRITVLSGPAPMSRSSARPEGI